MGDVMTNWEREFDDQNTHAEALRSETLTQVYGRTYPLDALDQWSIGHGRAFLNEYKSELTVKFFAQLQPGTAATGDVQREMPQVPFGRGHREPGEIINHIAGEIEKDPDTREHLYKLLYISIFSLQRNPPKNLDTCCIGFLGGGGIFGDGPSGRGDEAAEDGSGGDSPGKRLQTFTPLPLRETNVSACINEGSVPDIETLPSFGFPITDGVVAYPKAIVGVIDDAVNFTNQRFMASWGARTEFAWIQDAKALMPYAECKDTEKEETCSPKEETSLDRASRGPAQKDADVCRDRVNFGREYYRTEIYARIDRYSDDPDDLLKAFELDPVNSLDRPVGYLHGSHGTHVADLAAGYSASEKEHHNIRLQTVQLPALAFFDNSGMAMSFFILEGAKFILWRSLFLQIIMNIEQTLKGEPLTKLPVILNISYGLTGGPHSGGHYLERGLDQLIKYFNKTAPPELQLGPVDVVVPSGNEFLSRRFATARLGERKLDVVMRVPARDRTSNFLEFWLPSPKDIRIKVTPPAGLPVFSEPLELNQSYVLKVNGNVVARVSVDMPPGRETGEEQRLTRVLLAIAPTDTSNTESFCREPRIAAEPGRWRVSVEGQISSKEVIEAYIHSEDPNSGFPRRDPPCYFDMDNYERYEEGYRDWQLRDNDSVVKRFGTLNGFGNGRFATVVGAYRIKSLKESLYSGAARRLAQSYFGRRPSVMAPADLSRLNRGILATGTRSGSSFTQTGTSISAPFITRALAEASGELSAVSEILERAADFEDEIGHVPFISSEQRGEGRYPLKDLGSERELQFKRGLYE